MPEQTPNRRKEKAERRFDREFQRLQDGLPDRISRWVGKLRCPEARWVRIPVAILCFCGGFLGFLPVLGFWMVPVGIVLLAIDLPFLRRPTGRGLVRGHWMWRQLRRRYRLGVRIDPGAKPLTGRTGAARIYPTRS
ncbi:MAG TPA: hypothetical protein VED40_12065 [Azospirillaceae bacterium]|nr:hypothetical protein [Azospirillaceae bacterium]